MQPNEREAKYQEFLFNLKAIPLGYYTSYGQLADLCGVHVRQVLAWLKRLPRDSSLPWHRVMNSAGKIANHTNAAKQLNLLAAEGLYPDNKGTFPRARRWSLN